MRVIKKTYAIATRPPRRSAPSVLSNAGKAGAAPAGNPEGGDEEPELDIPKQQSKEDRRHENQEPRGESGNQRPGIFMQKLWSRTVRI
jgi:hypothetical protein